MYERYGKRLLDLVCSACGIVLLSPLFGLIAVAILCTDGRPVIYRQERVGLSGRPFKILKFRTMILASSAGATFDAGDRSRVTRIGRVLRATKLDEIPQLVNVLIGDMSLVGPRPEVPMWVNEMPDRWRRVLQVRPGITEQASVLYRNEEHELAESLDPTAHYRQVVLPRKLRLNEEYVQKVSALNDVRILAMTFFRLFKINAKGIRASAGSVDVD